MRLLGYTCTGLGALLATRLLGGWAVTLAAGTPSRVEDAVALLTATLGAAVTLWYALTALGLLLADLAASSRRLLGLADVLHRAVGRLGAPALRRAAVVGLGASLTLGAGPALAAGEVPDDLRPGVSSSLDPSPAAIGAGGAATTAPTGPDGSTPSADSSGGTPAAGPSDAATARPSPSTTQPPSEHSTGTTGPSQPPSARHPGDTGPSGRPGTSADQADSAPPPFRTVGRVEPGPADAAAARPAEATIPGHGAVPAAGDDVGTGTGTGTGTSTAAPPSSTRRSYVVREGDTLWQIAQAHLGTDADDAAVAREWPRWHTVNHAVIGDDPDLIHPGQTLLVPDPKDP